MRFGGVLGAVGPEVTPAERRTVPMETMTSPYLNKL